MATGTGKTVVMGMLIAWQALNKIANPQDTRFSDTFLIITPGITIRDRLRVLLPNDPENYYRQRDIISSEQLQKLGQAKIVITNFHAFLPRERALRAEVDEAAWEGLYRYESLPFEVPETGKIAVKVINHYGDEVMKVYT
jgi:type III restriction enzyme